MTEKAATEQEGTPTDAPEPAGEATDGQAGAGAGAEAGEETGAAAEAGADDAADAGEPAGNPAPAPSPESVEEALAEEELSQALDQLQDEFQALNDRHLRLAAEFTNYRRRQETEMTQAWSRAQSDLVRRFLDVLDDLHRVSGLDPADEAVSAESIVEGVDLVERKFLRTLEDAGVEVLEPEGRPFDPETMEAMMRVPAESEEDDDRVARVFQKGYVLKGHLVRPARVSVYKAE